MSGNVANVVGATDGVNGEDGYWTSERDGANRETA